MRTAVLMACLLATGCSVGMAMSGGHNPDLSVVRSGASRSEIEMQLGSPVQVASLDDGDTAATYRYEIGNEPTLAVRSAMVPWTS